LVGHHGHCNCIPLKFIILFRLYSRFASTNVNLVVANLNFVVAGDILFAVTEFFATGSQVPLLLVIEDI
jgi:hypothetical protein